MPVTAELVGRVGRLTGQHPPTEQGLTLTLRALPGQRGVTAQRITACALTADTLGVITQQGDVYAVHLTRQRYVCLDTRPGAGTSAAFMTRLSRRLFVGCSDGSIQCFDVSTSSRLAQLPGHRTAVTSLSTKPDTEQLLSASADAVLLWDMATFRQRRMLGAAPYGSSVAAFSPEGNLLAAATPAGSITIWDTKHLRELTQLQTPKAASHQQPQRFALSSMSISPDEQWLLVGCKAPALLLLYSLQDKALAHALQLPNHMYGVQQVQVLPDSSSAAVLTSDGCISFVDLQACCITGQLQLTFPGCRAVSYSTDPRANAMAVVCSDGLVRLYDLAVVRSRQQQQQGAGVRTQLERLQEAQLQQLSASADVFGVSSSAQKAGGRVLSDVGNVAHSKAAAAAGARKAKGAAAGPLAAGGSSAHQAAEPGQLRVRQLGAAATALNRRKLQEVLLAFGEFPARYRRLIWEHLLQLPHNSAAFSLLQDRGLHPAYKDLAQRMQRPGAPTSSAAVRLAACLSQLAHWCPLFGEVGFLPDFAFPFVKLFGPKAESAFEALATLLTNWCQGWFELFPNPPLPLLRRFLLLVCQHDLELGSHLQQLGVPLLERLWQHMSSGMSDLLPAAEDWLLLWDNCLAAAAGPAFYYSALAAYLISQRQLLLSAANAQDLGRVFDSRPAVDVRKVVKLAQQLHERTPDYAKLGASSLTPLPPPAAAGVSGVSSSGVSGSYPVFKEYPTGSVETQAQERQRIQEAEEALIRRRQVVAELQQRSKQVAYEAAALTSQRQQLAALDAQRRAALRAIEDSLATAGARLDDRAKEEKLKQIRLAEEAYQASLASLRAEWSAELAALKADVEHKRRLAAATLKARQEDEDIKALEFQAQQRLWALQQEELAAAGTSALRDAATTQASALAAQLQRRATEWQAQDEARGLKQQHELARKARLAAAAEQEAALQAAKGMLLAQELQAQEELAKVEHQRRLRQLAEDEAQLTAQQLQLQAERQAVAAAAGREAIQQQAQAQTTRLAEQEEARAATVAAEYEALQQQLAQLHLSAAELGSSARMSEAQQQLAQMETTLAAADKEHAARVAAILNKLQGGGHQQGRPSTPPDAGAAVTRSTASTRSSPSRQAATGPPEEDKEQAAEEDVGPSLAAIEQRLAAIRARRAALESVYGAQVDLELQRMLAGSHRQQSPSGTSSRGGGGAGGLPEAGGVPTSEASAGSGSSGVVSSAQQEGPEASSASGGVSVNVSAELETLLAEAEAEVQRELAAAREHFRGSGLHPHSSSRTPPLAQHHASLQSSVGGRGRGRSALTGSVAQQGSRTVSTGVGAGPDPRRALTAAAPAATSAAAASSGKLKPVLEEPPSAAGGVGGSGPKPADSSSSSSSSPDKHGDGEKPKAAQTGSSVGVGSRGAGASPPRRVAASPPRSPPRYQGPPTHGLLPAQVDQGAGSSSSHGSGVVHQGRPAAAAAEHRPAGGPAGGSSSSAYNPVLVSAPCTSRASADTERFLTALSGGQHAAASSTSSGGDTSSSSVSKPSSLTFGVVPPGGAGQGAEDEAPAVTPTLGGSRTQARTASEGVTGRSLGLEPSGRVSSELRQSSSATSEELEQLLQQLSQYEEHLMEEVEAVGGLPRELSEGGESAGRRGQGGRVDASLDSSMSWSQTLAGFTHLLPPPEDSS